MNCSAHQTRGWKMAVEVDRMKAWLREISTGCALAISCASCDATPTPASAGVTKTTTAEGVKIVTNTSRDVDSISWTIDTIPLFRIGEVDGSDDYTIGRLAGYLRRSDGTILVSDGISTTLRLYSAAGKYIRTIGGPGEGPGEYGTLQNILQDRADTVLVLDNEGSRVTVLDPSLNFVRRFRVSLRDGRPESYMTSHTLDGVFADAHFLMSDFLNVCGPSRQNGFCEDSVQLLRTDFGGKPTARYGRFVYSRELHIQVTRGFGTGWQEPWPQAFWRSSGGRTYYADSKRFEILVMDTSGAVEQVIRAPNSTRKYGRSEVFVKPQNSDGPSDARYAKARSMLEAAQAKAELPDSFPQFSDMLIDSDANVWVREYMPPGLMRGTRWQTWFVFDREGTLTHKVKAPLALSRFAAPWQTEEPQIGPDFILTGRMDKDGVESVVMYRLKKNAGSK